MSSLITNATIQIRKDTAGKWTTNNPTPAAGEFCLETDTGYVKIGNGSIAWTSLGYTFGATSATVSIYSTAWINRSDWTNVHIGSDDTKNADSNVTHSLNAPLSELIVKLFISTDGTDANSFEVAPGLDDHNALGTGNLCCGINVGQVDANNILIQTGTHGVNIVNTDGTQLPIDNEDWYYKIKVYKLA